MLCVGQHQLSNYYNMSVETIVYQEGYFEAITYQPQQMSPVVKSV